MTEHTPGPWEATANLNDGPYGSSYTIRKDSQVIVAGISGASLHRGPEQSAANAHLISASPDLLAALESLLTARDYVAPASVAHNAKLNDVGLWDQARAAIAKARAT